MWIPLILTTFPRKEVPRSHLHMWKLQGSKKELRRHHSGQAEKPEPQTHDCLLPSLGLFPEHNGLNKIKINGGKKKKGGSRAPEEGQAPEDIGRERQWGRSGKRCFWDSESGRTEVPFTGMESERILKEERRGILAQPRSDVRSWASRFTSCPYQDRSENGHPSHLF